ncbi:TonB-dependent receptor [Tenacibaculum finnmarkense]|uniref:TonB-dependent receptor n=1 Tax=Tenacibaculum finnmarkense genomovar ulcerans TaxID=2781388 RepID=A0A2I2M951_9FLAO|nr:TonB-dependent receptor [Tenacibaculum finnmarkense]MBE7633241.1 TonB-dependent receptor [Tenacibaculum finnmarkense genomovar ulcerans]MBE7696375.1 TonB-dependent receptor [Tenacibaculum finnmarkense genomovar ulcerans]MCD8429155.1 TonB-dependent receptor [Tenacibaculum finnmarkense genomovar ulcerans]SOU89078.1 conserved hypothetical protein [Tenacibaculum finnmarkense genomovar ulcerans]
MNNKGLLLLMMFVTSVIFSQDLKTIQGKITDKNGTPIENVTIIVSDINKGVYSNSKGAFILDKIKSNKICLKISKMGYGSITKNMTLSAENNFVSLVMSSKMEALKEVIVNCSLDKINKSKVSTNRLGAKAIDMPNSSDVVSKSLIEQQQALTLGEVMTNVSGVFQFNKGYGGVSETFGARGLSSRYLGFMFRDGTRFGTNQYLATPELESFEKVEVLKGGAAINFGYVSPGATINYVTKKPFFENKGSISFRYGSYDFIKPTLDYNFKLSEKLAFRFVSTTDMANSFRETVKTSRHFNYGAFRYLASENTTIDLNLEYLQDKRPFDFGLPIFEDKIITGYTTDAKGAKKPVYLQQKGQQRLYSKVTKDLRKRFIGSPFNNRNSNQFNANLKLDSQLDEQWNLSIALGTSISDYDYIRTGSGFSNQYFLEGNDLRISRTLEKQSWIENGFGAQINLTGKYAVLGMKNRTSFSIDYDNRNQKTVNYNSIRGFDDVYLFNKNTTQKAAVAMDKSYLGDTKFAGVGISFQNLLSITDYLNVLASVRMDVVDGSSENVYLIDYSGNKPGDIVFKEYDDVAFTPSIGLTYKLSQNNSIFASFTNTFNPNNRFRLNDDDEILPSFYTNQFELGTKNSFYDGKFNVNATYYMINSDGYVTSPNRPERHAIASGTKYKGLEFDLSAKPLEGVTLSANYSYIAAEYGEGGFFKAGTRPQQTPEHQLAFWADYKFNSGALKNFSLNFGGQYTGERLGNDFYRGNNPYIQKAYTLLNAGIGYQQKNFDVNLKVTNILDEFTFFAYRYGSVNPIDPTQFSVTTRYRF